MKNCTVISIAILALTFFELEVCGKEIIETINHGACNECNHNCRNRNLDQQKADCSTCCRNSRFKATEGNCVAGIINNPNGRPEQGPKSCYCISKIRVKVETEPFPFCNSLCQDNTKSSTAKNMNCAHCCISNKPNGRNGSCKKKFRQNAQCICTAHTPVSNGAHASTSNGRRSRSIRPKNMASRSIKRRNLW